MVFMPHWPKILGVPQIKLGLDRILEVLARLDNPQDKLPPVIHVAGTNGKGSTIAFMRSILESAGLKVHCYTSPHLLEFNERITIAGENISDDYLKQTMEVCRIATDTTPITFFEGTTIGAFYAFSQKPADVVLLETGLGGRLDATNVVKKPIATVITTISLDHIEYLGPTIELIAGEKAGIIKEGSDCIISLQTPEAFNVLQNVCDVKNSQSHAFEYDWIVEKTTENKMHFKSEDFEIITPLPNLIGEHQIINSANAIATLKKIDKFNISNQNIIDGITNAKWPARMQKITSGFVKEKLKPTQEFWLDGAHNDAAAYALASYVKQWDKKPLVIIIGMTKGRDVASFLSYFANEANFVCGVNIKTEPSAYDSLIISDIAKDNGFKSKAFEGFDEAIEHICNLDEFKNCRILCCGSLYLASDVLKNT